MTLQSSPQVFDRIQIRRIRRQEGDLDVSVQAVQVVAHETAAMSSQTVPDNQQRLLQVRLQSLEELDDLLLLETALVQSEQADGTRESGDHRDVVPVEVKLNDRCLSLQGPVANSRRSFADSRLVDEDDQTFLSLGFFLSRGQVRRFQ